MDSEKLALFLKEKEKRMNEAMEEANLPVPEFSVNGLNSFFTIVFTRSTPQKTPQKPTKLEVEILAFISKNSTATREEIASGLHISPETVKEYLAKLKEKGLLLRIGPDKGGSWEILS